jgi:hypothetical protein
MWSRLACRNGDPWRPFSRQGARLASTSICGKFGSNAHNLEGEEWCDALTSDAIALADRLIAEQNDRAWSL